MSQAFTIVGNNTEVGKTTVTCQIICELVAEGLQVAAFKPAASGHRDDDQASDWNRLRAATGMRCEIDEICPFRFAEPIAPLLAARQRGVELNDQAIDTACRRWRTKSELLLVETAGGLMSPLTDRRSNLDFAKDCGWPVIAVIENRLGAINQANLVCYTLHHQQLEIAAIVFNTTSISESQSSLVESNVRLFQELYSQHVGYSCPPCFAIDYRGNVPHQLLSLLRPSI